MRLDTDEARRRFATARVARLATVGSLTGADAEEGPGDGAIQPHLVPVTFAAEGEQIFIAVDAKPKTTKELKRLRNIREHPRVSLLVDHYAEEWDALWWVRADGVAQIIQEEPDRADPVRLLGEKYEQYVRTPPEGPVIAVTVRRWVGWSASA